MAVAMNRLRKKTNRPVLALVISVFLFVIFIYDENIKGIAEFPFSWPKSQDPVIAESASVKEAVKKGKGKGKGKVKAALFASLSRTSLEAADYSTGTDEEDDFEDLELPPQECDISKGNWIYDEESRPLYKEDECEFLTAQVTCMRNGRKESGYQNWKWQPQNCSLPTYKPRLLLRMLRNKRMMFVGDSLNRNQWESMVCMVQSVIPPGRKSLEFSGSRRIFKIEDYNATVEFYWAPFLVESNSDDPNLHSVADRIIMAESIDKHGDHWKDVDYLIFNTYIWWMNTPSMKVRRGSFESGSSEYDEIDRPVAYQRVLSTWSEWVEKHVDPERTTVMFISMSPLHLKSEDWNNPDGIKCAKETVPILNLTAPVNVGTDRRLFTIATNVTGTLKVPVHFLDITGLSEQRKDGHTSVHTIRQGKMVTPDQQADPATYADCIHWCLPGVPDTWNEFVYTKVISHKWQK